MPNLIQENTKSIAGISILTSNADAMSTIPELWGKFFSEAVASKISGKLSDDVYAIYTDFEHEGENNNGTYRFLIGVEVLQDAGLSDDLDTATIPRGNYHQFEVPGKDAALVFPTWQKIWSKDDIGKTFQCDFEKYSTTGDISINVGTSHGQ